MCKSLQDDGRIPWEREGTTSESHVEVINIYIGSVKFSRDLNQRGDVILLLKHFNALSLNEITLIDLLSTKDNNHEYQHITGWMN